VLYAIEVAPSLQFIFMLFGMPSFADIITCYHNLTLGDDALPDLPQAVYPKESPGNRSAMTALGEADPTVCYSMQSQDMAGQWSWQYGSMSRTACYKLLRDSQISSTGALKNVACCAAELCNKPEPTLDTNRQVRAACGTMHNKQKVAA
jgi:hypothetical protein